MKWGVSALVTRGAVTATQIAAVTRLRMEKRQAHHACHAHALHHKKTSGGTCGWNALTAAGMTEGLDSSTCYELVKEFEVEDQGQDQQEGPDATCDLRRVMCPAESRSWSTG